MRRWRLLWLIFAAILLVAALVGGNSALRITGIGLSRETPKARAALLTPYLELRLPAGSGPFPALALFSGCDGVRDNMGRWADLAVAQGWAALIVDSHTPRGFDDFEVWRLVCAGQLLAGGERAGDVAAALDRLRTDGRVDAARLALLGASHGGWAVLDMLGAAASGQPPHGLTGWPGGSAGAAMEGVTGAFLLYPYCGLASMTQSTSALPRVPVDMILVADDTITGDAPCRKLAERMQAAGIPADVETFTGVTHGFDQRDRSPLSPLRFDAAATDRAAALLSRWLSERAGSG